MRPASRSDINDLLLEKLPEILTLEQKVNKIRNLIYDMSRRKKVIKNLGTDRQSKWVLSTK